MAKSAENGGGEGSSGRLQARLEVAWLADPGEAVELVEVARLLAALDKGGRMAAAARSLEVSYRTAWGRLVGIERRLGLRLVERTKGHGSQVTLVGRRLLETVRQFEHEAQGALREPLAGLEKRLQELERRRGSESPPPLRVAASHDLLLQRCVSERRVQGLQVRFVGSEYALTALARSEADLAGFHTPEGKRAPASAAPAPGRSRFLVPVAQREQGLIVARGNPLRLRDVADLARPGLRFVNRQRGAGTRAWLDDLLKQGSIDASRIAGYDVEESTHLAVAATVAAGTADAAFGLRAAADRFGLGFVAIGSETYWLTGPRALAADPRVRDLLAAMGELARATPGYSPAPRGAEIP